MSDAGLTIRAMQRYDDDTVPLRRVRLPEPPAPQPGKKGNGLLIAGIVVVALVGIYLILINTVFAPGPEYSDDEATYLRVVKSDPQSDWTSWPDDQTLIEQGNWICRQLRGGAEPMTAVAPALLAKSEAYGPMMQYDQAMAQIGSAVGTLCRDQKWRFQSG